MMARWPPDRHSVDVVVAGGGPAGLVAAETIAGLGHQVVVFEREAQIAASVRTSGATSIRTMREFRIPEELYHPIARIRLCSPTETAAFQFSEPAGCVIDVRGMYRYLARRAAAAGAIIATGATVLAPLLQDGTVTGCLVKSDGVQRRVGSKVLIDASGYRAEVSKRARLHFGFARFGVGAEYELIAPRCSQDELVLVVGRRYAPAGYAWVFPWGRGRVRIGVGLQHLDTRGDPRRFLKVFTDEVDRFGVDIKDAEIAETHYGLMPAVGLARRIAGPGIMAVGDAAGVATLVAGEGIRLSMISGRMAGIVAVRSIASGIGSERNLTAYEKQFRAGHARDIRIGGLINKRMSCWKDEVWDTRVRFLKSVPPAVILAGLQSRFSGVQLAEWLILRPWLWPRFAVWAFKLLRDARVA